MKLTVLGSGIRTPLLLRGLVRRQELLGLREVVLHDTDAERLASMGLLATHLVKRWGGRFTLSAEPDPARALAGAQFVFSAIRVGQEEARIQDEVVPLRYGVLGQETTGPGGFAMALRTIPAMIDYARLIARVAPEAWLINFTNPAGLITQALRDHTQVKVIGICDGPTGLKHSLCKFLGVPASRVHLDYFGLNHLGWVRRVLVDGADRLPEFLDRYEELQVADHAWSLFGADLIRSLRMLPMEYLYFYYYRERAVENIRQSGGTRGQQLLDLNRPLWKALGDRLAAGDLEGALEMHETALTARWKSYMAREGSGTAPEGNHDHTAADGSGEAAVAMPTEHGATVDAAADAAALTDSVFEDEGYEGLAMAVMTAIARGRTARLILNVRNQGAIAGLADHDVVEVPCLVDQNGPVPLAVGEVPPAAQALMVPVKAYERLAVEAAVTGSIPHAVAALTHHPLVGSHSLATAIVNDYLQAHAPYLPQFRGRV